MTERKQIEEIRQEIHTAISKAIDKGLVTWTEFANYLTEQLTEQGYRKQSEGEWISVEEGLPSKEDLERSQFHNFLVTNEFGEVREAVFTGKYFAKLGSRLSGVTYWMPLPEPPKMKGGDE